MVNYEAFLPQIVAGLQVKEKTVHSLSDNEIRATVAAAYKEAIYNVALETGDYIIDAPVHLYEGLKDYTIEVPVDHQFNKVYEVQEVNATYPKAAYIDNELLRLPCCATKTINNAYTLRTAVTPNMTSNVCEFDEGFVNRHFNSILAYMRYTLSMQVARQWASLGHADRLEKLYRQSIRRHKNRRIQGVIKTKSERLTDHASNTRHSATNQAYPTNPCATGGCSGT